MASDRSNFSRITTLRSLRDMEVFHARLSGHRFPLHLHETFVVELVLEGADSCDASGLIARAGEIFIHCPNAAHTGGTVEGNPLEYRAIYPSQALVADLLGSQQCDCHCDNSFVLRCPKLFMKLARVFELIEQAGELTAVRHLMAEVMLQVCQHSLEDHSATNISMELSSARRHMIDHSAREVSISELSSVTGWSEFHLIREFKRAFGITPRQFLISQRVAHAKKLLSRGIAIVDVALQTGFADQSHLNRCFKRVSGFNPGQYVNG